MFEEYKEGTNSKVREYWFSGIHVCVVFLITGSISNTKKTRYNYDRKVCVIKHNVEKIISSCK